VLHDTPSFGSDLAIVIHGAREHNLQNISLHIPRDQFVVITGVSGSGKSTLAFDLLFAEGQRRFLDSMNTYARQFVEQMARPNVDRITGLPPTVSIEQRKSRGGGKSTVATVTEIHQFLRLLFSRIGTLYCPDCQLPVQAQSREELARQLHAAAQRRGLLRILAPVVRNRKGFHTEVAEWAAQHGYDHVRADGRMLSSNERLRLDRFREHDIEILVGTMPSSRSRRAAAIDVIETALRLGHGTLYALDPGDQLSVHSTTRACVRCHRSYPPLDPKQFSYNSAQGWCPRCRGFGELFHLPDVERGARAEAIEESWFEWQEGKRELCPECHGARLHPVARAVRLEAGNAAHPAVRTRLPIPADTAITAVPAPTIDTLGQASVDQAHAFLRAWKLDGRERQIAQDILPELIERLTFLRAVGLGYLQLGRSVPTLSGGEAQRIHLAAQLGSNLTGVLYILDEPTIGLHPRDNEQLLATLGRLRSRGNSLVVVEHDEATMRQADHVIDLGPGAGANGGRVVAAGTLAELMRHPNSITGLCLREHRTFPSRGHRRAVRATDPALVLEDARMHNLKDLTVSIPLQRLVLVTGVSGSGKSTLLRHCLLPAWRARLTSSRRKHTAADTLSHGRITAGADQLRSVYEVDQSPIGRTPRSIPATYVGFFDEIRRLFAQLPEARLRGYGAGRFSFNSSQGRCPGCDGAGSVKLEMNFLPPAFVTCDTCAGRRFNPDTLDIAFHGHNIAQVLALTVDEACKLFASFSRIARPLQALHDTGLGYLNLGQTSPTLSGGEAQRVKLVSHLLTGLSERTPRSDHAIPGNLFLLEEPTVGLHMADVKLLLDVLHRLVDAGHTVVVIEHNLDLIADADWILDLGPEGGEAGGNIVISGTPETVARCKRSHTGRFLASVLRTRSGPAKKVTSRGGSGQGR
jgi:excinuclease ABC subunit A